MLKKQKKSKEQTTANLFEASASSSEERDLGNDSGEEKVEARAPRKRKKRKDKICIAWRKGKCAKGDDCPYAHPNKKTESAKDSKTENRSLYIKVYASKA